MLSKLFRSARKEEEKNPPAYSGEDVISKAQKLKEIGIEEFALMSVDQKLEYFKWVHSVSMSVVRQAE